MKTKQTRLHFIAMAFASVAATPALADECLIKRDGYVKAQVAAGHKLLGDMPDRQVPAFLAAFNASPPAVVGKVNRIVAFEFASEGGPPVTRIAFFNDDCWVDTYDVPNQAIMKMMQEARSGYRI